MAIYLSIDGDDIGNKIAKSYLENDEATLARTIQELDAILTKICEYMESIGFEVIFCAADGIACKGQTLDQYDFAHYMKNVGKPDFTFSAGVGSDLQSAFFALKYAKAIGKDRIVVRDDGEKFKVVSVTI